MIKIDIKRDRANGQILAFTISGHAGYADHGQDIVCAAVTAISFGTVNAIEQVVNVMLEVEMEEEGGFLHCVVPEHLDSSTQEKVQLLLEAMIVALDSATEDYKSFVNITEK